MNIQEQYFKGVPDYYLQISPERCEDFVSDGVSISV